jgi:hypothetical protein
MKRLHVRQLGGDFEVGMHGSLRSKTLLIEACDLPEEIVTKFAIMKVVQSENRVEGVGIRLETINVTILDVSDEVGALYNGTQD